MGEFIGKNPLLIFENTSYSNWKEIIQSITLESGLKSLASVAATREPRRQLGAASKPAASSLNRAPADLLNSAPADRPKKKTAQEKPAKGDIVDEPTGWKMPAMPAPLGMA